MKEVKEKKSSCDCVVTKKCPKKLSKLGFSVELLEEFWRSFDPDVFVSFLTGKEPRARLRGFLET